MPSSVIRRYQYDRTTKVLSVVFTSGAVYDYFEVPPEVADAFAAARSKGEFFGRVIRPFFEFEKVRDPDEGGGWRPRA
jgi:uncharacterized Fe-S cluster-containing MiaB family protein